MKSRWMTSTRRLVTVAVCRLVVLLFWWNDVIRCITHAPDVMTLDDFMEFRFMDECINGRHPLQRLWEIVADQKREQLLHLGRYQPLSYMPALSHRSTTEPKTTRKDQHQAPRQSRDLKTSFGSQGFAHVLDGSVQAHSCSAGTTEQTDQSTQSGLASTPDDEPAGDQVLLDSSFLHNVKCPPTGATEKEVEK
ncbi:MAG: hypothetical protein ABIT37_00935 [Luteolibacter sp.]